MAALNNLVKKPAAIVIPLAASQCYSDLSIHPSISYTRLSLSVTGVAGTVLTDTGKEAWYTLDRSPVT